MTAQIHSFAPLDDHRAVIVAAFITLIEDTITADEGLLPHPACDWLALRFVRSGHATITPRGGGRCLTMLGIPALATGSNYALLRNWQTEAKARLSDGVRV